MARLRLFARRHLVRASVLAFFVALFHSIQLVAAGIGTIARGDAALLRPGHRLLIELGTFVAGSPDAAGCAWPAILLISIAALGVYFAAFRITQNRPLGLGAAALAAAHPLLLPFVGSPGDYDLLFVFAAAAWIICLQSRPRARSSRFPNRPPSPFLPATFAVAVAAELTSPHAAVLPFILLATDLAFERATDGTWTRRYWPGYLPYFLLPIAGLFVFGWQSGHLDGFVPSVTTTWTALVSPLAASRASPFVHVLTWIGGAVMLLVAAWDLATGVSRRRTLVLYITFFALCALASIISSGIVGAATDRSDLVAVLPAFALLATTAVWRVAAALWPLDASSDAAPVADLVSRLPPFVPAMPAPVTAPSLSGLEVVRRLESVRARLRSAPPAKPPADAWDLSAMRFPPASIDEWFSANAGNGGRVLIFAGRVGSYLGVVVARAGTTDVLAAWPEGRASFETALRGVSGVRVWSSEDYRGDGADYDLAIIVDVLSYLPAPTGRRWMTLLAESLKPGGRLLMSFEALAPDDASGAPLAMTPAQARLFVLDAGLHVVAVALSPEERSIMITASWRA